MEFFEFVDVLENLKNSGWVQLFNRIWMQKKLSWSFINSYNPVIKNAGGERKEKRTLPAVLFLSIFGVIFRCDFKLQIDEQLNSTQLNLLFNFFEASNETVFPLNLNHIQVRFKRIKLIIFETLFDFESFILFLKWLSFLE